MYRGVNRKESRYHVGNKGLLLLYELNFTQVVRDSVLVGLFVLKIPTKTLRERARPAFPSVKQMFRNLRFVTIKTITLTRS